MCKDKKTELKTREAVAVAAAVEALAQLHNKETRKKLDDFIASQNEASSASLSSESVDANTLIIPHAATFLNNKDPLFWYSCFVRLFPRGDCAERCPQRPTHLSSVRWVKTLLTRADFSLWRQDVEFIASAYNVFLRREQLFAVEASMHHVSFSELEKKELSGLTATGLVATALASGDVDSVRKALRKKDLEKPIDTALRKMQVIQRDVRGSEAEKDKILPKFFSLRLWSGCSSLFFTLNPHDIRSALTITLLQNDARFEKKFSLDWSDGDTKAYIEHFLRDNPRRLHAAVASNPLAATRCFHWTVKLVIRTLFNCKDSADVALDGIVAQETPGVFGHVRAYLGVVEPQMRKALHIHMLVQLLGFSHPEDLLHSDVLPNVTQDIKLSTGLRSTQCKASNANVVIGSWYAEKEHFSLVVVICSIACRGL